MTDTQGTAYPEFLSREDLEAEQWNVQPSMYPKTDIANHTMRIPTGTDKHSRAVRARELMRAKVSPVELVIPDEYSEMKGISPQVLDACEEVRINALNRHVGNNPDDIDRRELPAIVERAVQANDVNTLTELIVRTHGTKTSNNLARAVRVASKKFGKPGAAQFAKELRKVIRSYDYSYKDAYYKGHVADTDTTDYMVDGKLQRLPSGYRYTLALAHGIHRFLRSNPVLTGSKPTPGEGSIPEAEDVPSSFAPLILDKLHLTERVAGRMGRKRSATNIGINPRRIHRYLVDPDKRIFDKRIKGIGGVVLIDQSGSMSLSEEDVWDIIKASPGCIIIGYSDGGGAEPNCWVLAENGKVVSKVRPGNGGNGVDGPALLFALTKRKKGEPLIWVCDGHVTGRGDHATPALAKWCAKVVANHKVHMVPDVPSAVSALKQVRDGRTLPMRATGPVEWQMRRLMEESEVSVA